MTQLPSNDKSKAQDSTRLVLSLLDKIPVSESDSEFLIRKYQAANIETKVRAIIMLYDFIYNHKKNEVMECSKEQNR